MFHFCCTGEERGARESSSPSPSVDTAGESGVRPLTPITPLLYCFTSIHAEPQQKCRLVFLDEEAMRGQTPSQVKSNK